MPLSLNYVVKRVFWSILVIIGVVVLSYVILIMSPGDPAVKWAGNPRGPNAIAAVEAARRELGLDQPLYIQLVRFIENVFTGNIGYSIAYRGQSVSTIIIDNLTATLELLFITYLIAIPVGAFLGYYSALKRGTAVDSALQQVAIVLASTPSFWLGSALFLILTSLGFSLTDRVDYSLAVSTGFRPITGFYIVDALIQGNISVLIDVIVRLIPPAVAIMGYPIGLMIRVVRSLVAEELLEDYVNMAVALGVDRRRILWSYILRAVRPGIAQIAGMSFAYSLVDAMVVENAVFGRPGLGKLLVDSLRTSDFRIAVGLIVTVSVLYLIINTLSDVIQALSDPRVKL